jgi:predicted nucleic acid-binding protein
MAIASCLVDTNILLRMTRRSDPQHQIVDTALARLASQGIILHYTHQNVAELWNVMTRPPVRNNLGLTVAEAERQVRAIESGMSFLPASEAVYREWRRIVVQYSVLGVQVHDARLAGFGKAKTFSQIAAVFFVLLCAVRHARWIWITRTVFLRATFAFTIISALHYVLLVQHRLREHSHLLPSATGPVA